MAGTYADPQAPEIVGVGRSGRNATVQLLLRTGALRALSFLGTIVLARVLLPADYGVFAIVLFLVALVGPLGDLGLGAALIQKRERPTEAELATIFTAQQLIWLGLSVLIWLLAPLVKVVAPDLHPDSEWMLRALAIVLLIANQQAVPSAMMSRVLRFGPLAAIEVVQQVAYLAVAVTFALNGAGAWSFIAGLLVQSSIGTLLVYVAWGRRPHVSLDLAALRRMIGFGAAYQASSILHLFREAVVPAFGGLAGGVTAIGHLQFGYRLGRMVGGVDEVAARVAFPAFSRLQDDRVRLTRALQYAVEASALLLAISMTWSVVAAPQLIHVLFSDRWLPAVPVFQLTALAALVGVPALFLRGVGFAAGRARTLLVWAVATTIITIVAFPLLVISFGLAGGGLGFMLFALLQFASVAYVTRALAPFPWLSTARIYLLGGLASVCALPVLESIDGLSGLFLSGLVALSVYALLIILFERAVVRRSWHWLRRGSPVPVA